MNTWIKVVEDSNTVPFFQKSICQMRTDKTGTPANQDTHLSCALSFFLVRRTSSSGSTKNNRGRLPKNLAIQPQRPVADVLQVKPYPIVEIPDLVSPGNLPKARNSRFHHKLLFLPFRKLFVLRLQRRPRPDQAHVTNEHTEQLW